MEPFKLYIDIAVKPAVKKFIASKLSVEPFVVSTSNYFGSYLQNCLVKLKCHPAKTFRLLKPEIYTERLDLEITEDMWRRYGWYIPSKKQYFFNQMVEDIMNEQFQFYMEMQTIELGRRQRDSYLNFRELFSMGEDDLSLKTMEKRWERSKGRLSA